MERGQLGKLWHKRKRKLQFVAQADENVKHTRRTGIFPSETSPYFKPNSTDFGESSDVRPSIKPSHTAEKQVVCPPLPISRFLTKELEEPAATLKTTKDRSGSEVCNENPLPPPNMDYLTRKQWVPLKWSQTNICSGFVLEDNTVVFIGTRKCEKTIRQSFLHHLRRGEGDLDDSLESLCADNSNAMKAECNPETFTDEIQTAFPTKNEESSIILLSDSESPSLPSSIENKTCESTPERTHPAMRNLSDSDASSDSDIDDLPRVQVTGLPIPTGAGSSNAWKTSDRAELQSETGNTWQKMSGRGATSCEGSCEPSLLKCPICNISLPLSYSQFAADEHIALCLSADIDAFEDD